MSETTTTKLRRQATRVRVLEAEVAELMKVRRAEGASLRQIAEEAGITHTGVAKILARNASAVVDEAPRGDGGE